MSTSSRSSRREEGQIVNERRFPSAKIIVPVAILALGMGVGAWLLLSYLLSRSGEQVSGVVAQEPDAVTRGHGRLTVNELKAFDRFAVFWLGEEYRGLQLKAVIYERISAPPDGERPGFEAVDLPYGDCDPGPGPEASCVLPLTVYNEPSCLNRPSWLAEGARKEPPMVIRGARAQQTISGSLHIYTAMTTVIISSVEGDGAAAAAALSLTGVNDLGKERAPKFASGLGPSVDEGACPFVDFPKPRPTRIPQTPDPSAPRHQP